MKTVDLEQGTDAWLEWRASRWMASEAAIIMDACPNWFAAKTWDDLRLQKAGLWENDERAEKAFAHGHKMEPVARAFLAKHGIVGQPACGENSAVPRLAASFDMLSDDFWVEIKCPMSKRSKLLDVYAWKDLPAYYQWQMIHQYATIGKNPMVGYFCAYINDTTYRLCKWHFPSVLETSSPPIPAIEDLLEGWERFEAGESQDNTDPEWAKWAGVYRQHAQNMKAEKAHLDDAKEALLRLAGGKASKGSGVSVSPVTRAGTVDAKAMQEAGIDVDSFRKPAVESWTVRLT